MRHLVFVYGTLKKGFPNHDNYMESARRLGKYQTVEIKQKYFDKKKNREIEVSLKTLEKKVKVKKNPNYSEICSYREKVKV